METYFSIRNPADIADFMEKTNALHDGYIIAVEYQNDGIKSTGDTYEFHSELKRLKIRVLITSMQDAVLEMLFENVSEWRITEAENDILEAAVAFNDNGSILWTDCAKNIDTFKKNGSYAIAESMKWRIL